MAYELISKTIPEQLAHMEKTKPDHIAYIFPDENIKLTFSDVGMMSDMTAKAMLAMGLKHGDHIGIWSVNCSRWIELLLGASKLGIVVVPLNTCYQYEELDDLCYRGDLSALFLMDSFNGRSCHSITDQFFENGEIKTRYPLMKYIISMEDKSTDPYMSWNAFIKKGVEVSEEELATAMSKVSLEDDYLIQYTSGTEAKPKGAILYQYGVMNTAKAYGHLLHLTERDCTCVPLPLFHCFGNILTLLGGMISGSTTIFLSTFSPKKMLTVMQEEECTCMMGVPTMYFAMLATPEFEKYNLSKLEKGGIGGSICPYELCRKISDGFNIKGLIIGYGLSEAASLCTLSDINCEERIRIGTVGTALPGLEVSLADSSGDENAEISEGEIIVRGYGVMKGYYNDPEHTKNALDSDRWLHTGDLGKRNADGTFVVIGRLKDIIIKGGENISPSILEEKLLTMPNVRECQCVGVPDEKYGEVVCACIISEDGKEIKLEDIKNHLKGKVALYKIPDYSVMVESFPINGAGKILKGELGKIARGKLHL